MQEPLAAIGAGGEHDMVCVEPLPAAAWPGARPLDLDAVARLIGRPYSHDCRIGDDHRAGLLSEVQIILGEGVLGVVPAAGHAGPALQAPGPARARATEIGIVGLAARLAEVHPDRREPERPADLHVLRHRPHELVCRGDGRILYDTEHALGLFIERCQLGPPVGDPAPLRIGVEVGQRLVQRVRVHQRPATDARPGQDHHVAQQVDSLDTATPKPRRPQEPAHVPRGFRVRRLVEASAGLDHRDPVALFDQAQGSDRTAEARADDDDVEAPGPAGSLAWPPLGARATGGCGHRTPMRFRMSSPRLSSRRQRSYDIRRSGASTPMTRRSTAIVCGSVKRSRPSRPWRRPSPLFFMPPIGAPVDPYVAAYPSLTLTVPASRRAAMRRPLRVSRVQTLALRPYGVWFARSMTSFTSRYLYTATTGPKVSSVHTVACGGTLARIVGSKKYGPMSERGLPPASTAAPFAFASSTCSLTFSSCALEVSEPMSAVKSYVAASRILPAASANRSVNASYGRSWT